MTYSEPIKLGMHFQLRAAPKESYYVKIIKSGPLSGNIQFVVISCDPNRITDRIGTMHTYSETRLRTRIIRLISDAELLMDKL